MTGKRFPWVRGSGSSFAVASVVVSVVLVSVALIVVVSGASVVSGSFLDDVVDVVTFSVAVVLVVTVVSANGLAQSMCVSTSFLFTISSNGVFKLE